MKKRFFNMIEVMLALAVSAIGITAIMGIIPLGLKANRDAMSDTFAADIANSYFAQLSIDRAKASSFSDFVTNKIPFTDVSASKESMTVDGKTIYFYKNPDTPAPKSSDAKFMHAFDKDGVDFDTSKWSDDHYIRAYVGKKNGSTEVMPDFVADLCGWMCYPTDITEAEGAQTDLIRVYLEVSWPINAPYEKREKRVFVREFFNTKALLIE